MPQDYSYEKRKFVVGAVAAVIIVVYLIRLFTLQLMSDDYRKSADSNAFRKEIIYPSRGLIMDRNGKLLVYNEPSYNILVTMLDQHGVDTLDFAKQWVLRKRNIFSAWKKSRIRRRIQDILAILLNCL